MRGPVSSTTYVRFDKFGVTVAAQWLEASSPGPLDGATDGILGH